MCNIYIDIRDIRVQSGNTHFNCNNKHVHFQDRFQKLDRMFVNLLSKDKNMDELLKHKPFSITILSIKFHLRKKILWQPMLPKTDFCFLGHRTHRTRMFIVYVYIFFVLVLYYPAYSAVLTVSYIHKTHV